MVDVLQTLPPRPLRLDEQALVAEWLAAAGDIARAYVSQRRSDDPAIYRRIVIVEDANSGPTYLIHTPSGMDIWILLYVSPELGGCRFDSLRDALNFVRPVLASLDSTVAAVRPR